MLQTEYVRNLNANYERILLDKKPEENRYQYCIIGRGGIRGLLACSLRYINGLAYLYYDISSKQNVVQRFGSRCITREWIRDFIWSMRQIRQELGRFLLDSKNVLWYPEQIFQDLDSNVFSFMYIPYYEGENGFLDLVEFWVDHIDYNDEGLVEWVYHVYDQAEKSGSIYLQSQIFEDVRILENAPEPVEQAFVAEREPVAGEPIKEEKILPQQEERDERKGLLSLFENRRRRNREARENYQAQMMSAINGCAVAEDSMYDCEEYGRTVYIEEKPDEGRRVYRLYTSDDRLLKSLDKPIVTIGKKKEEADVVLEDSSVSRLHARIILEGNEFYLEDLNSTNGTYKNGLRLNPYEKRKLRTGDELKCGRVALIFR